MRFFVNKLKCDKCKRCIEECPNKAITLGEDGYPVVDPVNCQRCGICAGGCPLGVIALPDYRLEEVGAMLSPLSSGESPTIVSFFCDFAYSEADLTGQIGGKYPPNLYIIRVPCSGAVNMITVNDAIAEGIDGIMVVGCYSSQCKYRKGNELARYRIGNCQKGLEEQFLEKERLVHASLGEGVVEASVINQSKCARCGLCEQLCPYGAIKMTATGSYEINPAACRGCGTCIGACRSGAIDSPQHSNEKIMAAVKSALAN
ncbi:hydrogenase iron-sulfur subunit [Desulfotruncus alcoholivorax]|uniref:hydrogenase iron-sulfur subunit n=1 Tax=Desulfotruncus alcoholivorax TaxID=265477 RepID=UPI001EE540EC|nr:hydrogenase iron-sulfur subunit [Desulfotruncus alcoholivorax]